MTLKTPEMTGTKSKFRSKFRFRLYSVPATGRNFSGILNLAWQLVKKEEWMNILPCTRAFKIKRFPDGTINKFKARFCVCGDKEKAGIDFWETWSAVVHWSTVRTMMILSTKLGLSTAQADITAAFVHANLKPGEHIYVHQPPGFNHGSDMVLALNRSVYRLKQAPRYFWKHLTSNLGGCGLT
jgi:hypothetical protein